MGIPIRLLAGKRVKARHKDGPLSLVDLLVAKGWMTGLDCPTAKTGSPLFMSSILPQFSQLCRKLTPGSPVESRLSVITHISRKGHRCLSKRLRIEYWQASLTSERVLEVPVSYVVHTCDPSPPDLQRLARHAAPPPRLRDFLASKNPHSCGRGPLSSIDPQPHPGRGSCYLPSSSSVCSAYCVKSGPNSEWSPQAKNPSLVEIGDGPVQVAFERVGDPADVEGRSVLRVEGDGLVVVGDGPVQAGIDNSDHPRLNKRDIKQS